jgi:aspartyl-tRNA(Asn)/glutamyl-tRNA(Gln) amidotransferase subunit B
MAERFVKADGLPDYDAAMMTQSLATARFYEAARDAGAPAKLVANWTMGEISRRLNADGLSIDESPVDAALLATLIRRIQDGTISNNAARQVFDALWTREKGTAGNVDTVIETLGLKQMNDSGELESIIDAVLAANQKSIDEFKAGKDKAFQALVGQAMKASKGKANPAQVNELLKKKLGV